MKAYAFQGTIACIYEGSEGPGISVPRCDDAQARILAAVATIEKESPVAFAAELAKAKSAAPHAVDKEKTK